MDVTEAIERYHFLAGEGRHEEGLQVLIQASYEHSDPALEHEISLCYEERAWARCEDRSLLDGPSADVDKAWDDGTRSDARALGDFEESLSWAERPEPMAGKAALLLKTDPDAAERLLRQASELDPESALVALVKARLLLSRRDWAEAVEAARRVVEKTPESPAAHAALAAALKGAGKKGEALEALRQAASSMPYNVQILVAWARTLDEAGERDAAADVWRRAAQVNRRNPEAWRGLAANAEARGDDDERMDALREAERLDPASGT